MNNLSTPEKQALNQQRREILEQLEDWLEMPMLILGLLWLVLFLIELIWGLSPLLEAIGWVIWVIFILNFTVEFILAPRKMTYLKNNWLTVISLLLPALRVFRFARVLRVLRTARATRGLQLFRVIARTNRGMRSLSASLGRRGFGYVAAVTLVITLVGAGGMYAFESNIPNKTGLNDYGSALWWAAMLMTTNGVGILAADSRGASAVLPVVVVRFCCVWLLNGSDRHFLYWTRCRRRYSRTSRGKVYTDAA